MKLDMLQCAGMGYCTVQIGVMSFTYYMCICVYMCTCMHVSAIGLH